mgnify:CR=1 FL=1
MWQKRNAISQLHHLCALLKRSSARLKYWKVHNHGRKYSFGAFIF